MSDPERIWLQNAADARATGDRLWCQDKVWPECDEQQEPTEYIRADLYASRISQQDAELERWKARAEYAEANLAETRRVAFIEAAEIADGYASMSGTAIAAKIRAKAEETGR